MIRVLIGDIFESQAQTLTNTVNCVGVMGKGIALGFRSRFPDMYKDYVARCNRHEVKLGRPYLYRTLIPPAILNFPTKDHWRSVARLEDIVAGLDYLESHYQEWGITSLAVPPLGCGEGQLEWRVVGRTLYRHLARLDILVELYAPFGTPSVEIDPEFLQAAGAPSSQPAPVRIPAGLVALVEILRRIERQPYHWPVGRTMFQKIAYFATEAGVPTGLSYEQGSYGPYSASLKRRTTQLVNNGLVVEQRLGQMLAVKVGPTFLDAEAAYQAELEPFDDQLESVGDLFARMNTNQAEVAATVHFAAKVLKDRLGRAPSESDVLAYAEDWKMRRRPPIGRLELASAIRNLAALGWMDVRASKELPVPEEMAVGT